MATCYVALPAMKYRGSRLISLLVVLASASVARSITIGFEASEGFSDVDQTPFQGTSVPAGIVDLWNIAGSVANLQIDEGPGGGGALPEPAPKTGTQQALILNSGPGTLEVTMDLNNAQAYSLTSFQYANRGTYPPNLLVEYYDLSSNLIGSNRYRKPNPTIVGSKGVGLDAAFNPAYQQLVPSLFQNVPLSKIVFRGVPPAAGSQNGRFYLDDILLQPNSTGNFNPNNYARVSFETSEGFGGNNGDPVVGVTIPNLIDAFIDNNNESYTIGVQHGWNAPGFAPLDLDDPVEGNQVLFVNANGDPDGPNAQVEIDLNNAAEASLKSFYFEYRGNFADQTLTVEYFGLNEASLGTETFTGSPDGGQNLGMDTEYYPDFDLITVGQGINGGLPSVVGVPMSKLIITSHHNHPEYQFAHSMFGIDELRFSLGSPPDVDGDYNGNGIVDGADYVVWRNNKGLMGGATVAQGDGTGDGNVTDADYNYWRARFGNTSGSGSGMSSSTIVPEPAAWILVLSIAVCVMLPGNRRCFRRFLHT